MTSDDPLGIDLADEALVVSAFAVPALRVRLQRALVTGAWRRGFGAGVATALVSAMLVAITVRAVAPAPRQPAAAVSVVAAPVRDRPHGAAVTSTPGAPDGSLAGCPAQSASTRRAPPRVKPAAAAPDPGVNIRGSALRAQLRLYDLAKRQIVGGDLAGGRDSARGLRTRYPEGPLALDAGVLELRALVFLRETEAAVALDAQLADAPHAHDRARVLEELHARVVMLAGTVDSLDGSRHGSDRFTPVETMSDVVQRGDGGH